MGYEEIDDISALAVGDDVTVGEETLKVKAILGCNPVMGTSVFRCINSHGDQRVLRVSPIDSKILNDRSKEARQKVDMPMQHLPTYRATDHTNTHALAVLNYIPGSSLELADFSEKEQGEYLTEVIASIKGLLKIVMALTDAKVVHGDLSPGNVIRSGNDIAVIDIERMRIMGERPVDEVVGTTLFLSPEIIRHGKDTETTDMYSVGLIALYSSSRRWREQMEQINDSTIELQKLCGIFLPEDKLRTYFATSMPEKYEEMHHGFTDFIIRATHNDPEKRLTAREAIKIIGG